MRGDRAEPFRGARATWRVAREAGLLGIVAAFTWVSVGQVVYLWSPVHFMTESRWTWAFVAGTVLVTLLRLWAPAVAVVAAAALFGWLPASGIAVTVTAYTVSGRYRPPRRRFAVLGVAAVTGYAIALSSSDMPKSVVTSLHLVTALVCLGLPAGVRALLAAADHVVRTLRERAHFLEENYRLAQSTARLQERSRIAQEMHDQLGHRLSLISLYAGAMEMAATSGTQAPDGGAAQLIRGTAQTAMHELRTALGILRSADSVDAAALQPAQETGLRPDIARLVEQSRSAGVEIGLTWQGADLRDVALPVRRAVHRVVREGLTNVHRHAPGSTVSVVVERAPDHVRVEISDERGPVAAPDSSPPAGAGMGLVGVQERVTLLGGSFVAGRTGDGGFRLAAELPLRMVEGTRPVLRRAEPDRSVAEAGAGAGAGVPSPDTAEPLALFGRWAGRGTSAVLGIGLVAVAALVAVACDALPWYSSDYRNTVRQPGITEVAIGMTRAQVTDIVGSDDAVARLAARSVESPRPPADTCTYAQQWSSELQDHVVRFCFRRDVLIRIDRFRAEDGSAGDR
ncbi:sensor histidine kinase [Streptomyces sp. NPDC090499]|uniref:sensor histidine kinase n=1 Tax=Streptomyces sp. NPDC090499 TaxID=3365965 RepID=UPI00380A6CDE